jgi:Protein of unknown function (DUF3996)
MKFLFYVTVLAGGFGFCAWADESTDSNMPLSKKTTPDYTSESYAGRFGAGVIVGEPTGVSLKYWLNDTMAVDGAVGGSFDDDTVFYMASDVLWHNFELIPVPQGRMPVYIGVGGLVRFRDDNQDDEAGVRIPVGVSYMFENAPVDIFVEVGPAVDIVPDVRGDLTGGIGVRFWF